MIICCPDLSRPQSGRIWGTGSKGGYLPPPGFDSSHANYHNFVLFALKILLLPKSLIRNCLSYRPSTVLSGMGKERNFHFSSCITREEGVEGLEMMLSPLPPPLVV